MRERTRLPGRNSEVNKMADSKKVIDIIGAVASKIEEKKDELTALDQPIGDSDHGINMARGFCAVQEKLPELEGKDIGTILKTVGMTLISKVGGASGPLYGSAFMKSGTAMAGKQELTSGDFIACLDTSVHAVEQLGHACAGEATMLDAMIPALAAMKQAESSGRSAAEILCAGSAAAEAGAESTKDMIATKGRASYVGERGRGHRDPGASSFALMMETIADALRR